MTCDRVRKLALLATAIAMVIPSIVADVSTGGMIGTEVREITVAEKHLKAGNPHLALAAVQQLDDRALRRTARARADGIACEAHLGLGNSTAAVEACTTAMENAPADWGLYNNRGVAYGRLSDFKAAVADFNQAIKLAPEEKTAYRNKRTVELLAERP